MGHKNKLSLVGQVDQTLRAKLAIGESRHADKKAGKDKDKIYSWGTFSTYLRACIASAKWVHEEYGCTNLQAAQPLAGLYLEHLIDRDYSPYSIRAAMSALGKLYGCRGRDFDIDIPPRHRADITRSRGEAVRDKGFSRARNKLLVSLAECSGLRRSELACLTGDQLVILEDGYGILVDKGTKGGRTRIAPLVGPEKDIDRIIKAMGDAECDHVFSHINSHADIHAMRAVYASRVYAKYARTLEECQTAKFFDKDARRPDGGRGAYTNAVYYCRRDRKGVWYDKEAMKITSEALGHARISVIAGHYLHGVSGQEIVKRTEDPTETTEKG